MSRRLFTILSAGSLFLCVAFSAMWARSQDICDLVWYGNDTRETGVMFTRRAAYSYHETVIGDHRLKGQPGFGHGTQPAIDGYRPERVTTDEGFGEFRYISGDNGRTNQYIVSLPYWFLVVATSLLPAARVAASVRRKPVRAARNDRR